MKPQRYNKVIGLSLGDSSLLAAEVAAGDKPAIKRLAEFVYPAGLSLLDPAALGKALGDFLRANQFTAKSAVVGIPAKWLAIKTKDVPPADAATLAEILRLQAEGEFSADLKDLVYDYAGHGGSSVVLIATPRKHVDAATALCEAAGLTAVGVTPSVVALGSATSRAVAANAMVLAVGAGGAEFTAQHGPTPIVVRPMRSPSTGELRRAISAVPANSSPRELVLWDDAGPNAAMDATSLGNGIGVTLRTGELATLGADTAQSNGNGRKFAGAVALALEVLGDRSLAIDFLHSRLAETSKPAVPRWAVYAALAVIVLVAACVFAYTDLQSKQSQLVADKAKLDKLKPDIAAADAFVSKVTFAKGWQGGDPRYIACIRDLTEAMPTDDQAFATSLVIREQTQVIKGGKVQPTGRLSCTIAGKASDQDRAKKVVDRLSQNASFSDVKSLGTQDGGRGRDVSFSITFNYKPGKG